MTPRDRQALRLGGLVVLGAFMALRAVPWLWREGSWLAGRLGAERAYVAHADSNLARIGALADSTHRLTERVAALAPRILSGETRTEATAALAGLIGHLAVESGARLDATAPVADTASAGTLRRLSMDVTVESDVRGLSQLLGRLATIAPVLACTRIRVTTGDPLGASGGPEVLRIEMRVVGWFLEREAA